MDEEDKICGLVLLRKYFVFSTIVKPEDIYEVQW